MQPNSAAFRLKLGTTNTRVEVCSTAFMRNPALAGPYWRYYRATNYRHYHGLIHCDLLFTHGSLVTEKISQQLSALGIQNTADDFALVIQTFVGEQLIH